MFKIYIPYYLFHFLPLSINGSYIQLGSTEFRQVDLDLNTIPQFALQIPITFWVFVSIRYYNNILSLKFLMEILNQRFVGLPVQQFPSVTHYLYGQFRQLTTFTT